MAQLEKRKTRREAEGDVSGRVGTLTRGLATLEILVAAALPLSLTDIAEAACLDQSTALRILRTLEENGYVLRAPDGRRYIPSPRTIRPMPLLHPVEQFRREVDLILRGLATKVGKTVVLVVFLGMERLVVDVFQSPGSLSPYYTSWLKGPLHASGPGKALLLTMSPQKRAEILGVAPFEAHTPSTITSPEVLEKDLEQASARGFVIVRDEFYLGVSALAATYSSWSGRTVGCIAVTGHTEEFDEEFIAMAGAELVRRAKLMPLQAASLRSIDQVCGF